MHITTQQYMRSMSFKYDVKGTLAKDPSDMERIVGQRARDIGLQKCSSLLSVLEKKPWLTQVNLHFKTPPCQSSSIRSSKNTYDTLVMRCKGPLEHRSSGHRRNLKENKDGYRMCNRLIYQSGNLVGSYYNIVRSCTYITKNPIQGKHISNGGTITKEAKALANTRDSVVELRQSDKSGKPFLVKRLWPSCSLLRKHLRDVNLRYKQVNSLPRVNPVQIKINPHLKTNNTRLNFALLLRRTLSTCNHNRSIEIESSDRVSNRRNPLEWPKT
jgi:hypothetical protein